MHIACAAKGGDHFIGDQQNAMLVAHLAHHGHKAFVGHDHPASAEHGLHDHGGDGVCALEGDFIFQHGDAAIGDFFCIVGAEWISVRPWGGDLEAAGQHRLIIAAEIGVAIDGRAAKMGAVIAFF